MRKLIFWLLMLCMTLAGTAEAYQAKRIPLENIQKLELISVAPQIQFNTVSKSDESKTFHGYPVLGRQEIDSRSAIQEIIGAMNGSLRPHVAKKCLFMPRHALKIFYKDSEVEYLICYQCGDVEKFHGSNDKEPEWLSIEKSSKGVLDRFLTEAKIPLAS